MTMPLHEPRHCRLDAFTALRDHLPQIDTTSGLVRCAVAVSMHELDHADIILVESELDDYAQQILDRVQSDDPRALLAHTHLLLFEEARFRGNMGDYDNPRNNYLTSVLRIRLGLPLTLTLIYKAVLDRVGVPVVGINAPGHFFAGVRPQDTGQLDPAPDQPLALIDVFAGGRLLTRKQALARIRRVAPFADITLTDPLAPTTHPQWLIHIIDNLMDCFEKRDMQGEYSAMLEMLQLVESETNAS